MTDRAVLVTGCSTGIGEAAALRLDRSGWQVFAGVRKEADGERLRAQAAGRLTPVIVDVTDAAAIDAAVKEIDGVVGSSGLAGVVNNAGVGRGGPLEYLPIEEWREQLEINVVGQVAVTKATLPLVRRARGRVVFIGSIGGRICAPLLGPYSASKFALEAIAEALRHELRPAGIKVVLIEPGAVKTAIWDKARSTADELEQRLPAEALDRYRPFIDRAQKSFQRSEKMGITSDKVAQVIERALTADRPRARYLVGPDAKLMGVLTRVLPDRARDVIVGRFA
jgi:NAD(P)-dependent dehydrogenase (short-subunit alcohol dehydrogenase family)